MTTGLVTGIYEAADNILHLWNPQPVRLDSKEKVDTYFKEVEDAWVRSCPQKPFLLVSYGNLHIPPQMTEAYGNAVARLKPLIRGTYRYQMPADLTGVAVSLGNARVSSQANIFPDEKSARGAIAAERLRSS